MSVSDAFTIESQVEELTDEFRDLMTQTYEEEPSRFGGQTTRETWFTECESASKALTQEINEAIQRIEIQLYNGDYRR